MWLKAVLLIVIALSVVVAGVITYGASRWKTGTNELRTKLEAVRLPISPVTYDAREIENLPPPVRRYFHAVLKDGQAIVSAARLTHEGQFNMGETQAKWSRFTSSQVAITRRPGFDWDGRIAMAPGLNVLVHDAYVAGEGILHAELLGLVTLADIRGTPEAAQGELMRFLADENFNNEIVRGVRRQVSDVEIVRVQDTELAGKPDVEVLAWASQNGYLILSHDVNTMRGDFYQRLAAGFPVPGLFLAHGNKSIGEVIDSLVLIALASEPDEWVGQIHYLPFQT